MSLVKGVPLTRRRERAVPELAGKVPVSTPAMPRAADLLPYLERIDSAGWYSNFGPLVVEFEARLSQRFEAGTQVVTIANGTIALSLVLQALELPAGAYCAVPSWTFVATAHAIRMAGLKPWFVDVEPVNGALTPEGLSACLLDAPGPVVGVIPVAVMGQPMDLSAWQGFESRTGIRVVIDAAAGFDAVIEAPVPVMVSLHATKSLGIGEGAFVACRDGDLIRKLRAITNFGFMGDRISRQEATNAKLSEYSAAVGLAALDMWPSTRLRYMNAARMLRIGLSALPVVALQEGWGLDWVSSTCVVGLPSGASEFVEAELADQGIDSRRWWGLGCHRAPAFQNFPAGDLRVTEALAASTLGIPFFASMEPDQINRTVNALSGALHRFEVMRKGSSK